MNLYKTLIRPLLFQVYPETAHHLSSSVLKIMDKAPFVFNLLENQLSYSSPRLKQSIAGIEFDNPLGLAAGFDKTGELYPFFSRMGFGFIEVGTITGEGQPGNPKPRVFRFPEEDAIVNRMGFNNPGSNECYDIIQKQKKIVPRGINAGKTKIVSLENSIDDYVKTFTRLASFADYFVMNISSPNTPGLRDLQNKENFSWLLSGVQGKISNFNIPLFVKFAPDLADEDIPELLDICLQHNVKGVILTNTTLDKSPVPRAQNTEGGLSGKPLRDRSTHLIRLAYQHLKGRIPIIGVGGINSGESALEKIRAGANLIQIYTGYIYEGPALPRKILNYLDLYMAKNKISAISEIVGNY